MVTKKILKCFIYKITEMYMLIKFKSLRIKIFGIKFGFHIFFIELDYIIFFLDYIYYIIFRILCSSYYDIV